MFWRRKNEPPKIAFIPALIHATEYARVCGEGYLLISRQVDEATGQEFFTYQAIPPAHVVILS